MNRQDAVYALGYCAREFDNGRFRCEEAVWVIKALREPTAEGELPPDPGLAALNLREVRIHMERVLAELEDVIAVLDRAEERVTHG